jgi:hypothetical protein
MLMTPAPNCSSVAVSMAAVSGARDGFMGRNAVISCSVEPMMTRLPASLPRATASGHASGIPAPPRTGYIGGARLRDGGVRAASSP